MLLLVFSTTALAVVLVIFAVYHLVCRMMLFQGHVTYQNFAIPGPVQ